MSFTGNRLLTAGNQASFFLKGPQTWPPTLVLLAGPRHDRLTLVIRLANESKVKHKSFQFK